jgi:hypothetical protein
LLAVSWQWGGAGAEGHTFAGPSISG